MSEVTESALLAALSRVDEQILAINDLKRLSGGASQELWAFTCTDKQGNNSPLILRRIMGGADQKATESSTSINLDVEGLLVDAAEKAGVPAPALKMILTPADGLGMGYIMTALEGETIARKILRDDEFKDARPVLAGQCGAALARIHALDPKSLPDLPVLGAAEQVQLYREIYEGFGQPHPVFEYALKHLETQMPEATSPAPVHGDFRNGNLMIGPKGLVGVLDWELAHLGDPMEDLGWLCVTSWRFGEIDNPVGGFGQREDLFAGYEAAGGAPVDPQRVHFWEVFGTLKWGIICLMQARAHLSGQVNSVERAAIGRRASETEIDLLNLLT